MTCDTAETLLSEEMVRCCGGGGFVAIEVEMCFLFSSMHTRMCSLQLSFYGCVCARMAHSYRSDRPCECEVCTVGRLLEARFGRAWCIGARMSRKEITLQVMETLLTQPRLAA